MKARLAVIALLATASIVAFAQTQGAAQGGLYTAAQAARGQAIFAENCASCHASDLAGDPYAPALAGASFASKWKDRPLGDLFELMRVTMPQTAPGGLSRQANADLMAFILQKNQLPAGKNDLLPQPDALRDIKLAIAVPASAPPVPAATATPAAAVPKVTSTGEGFYSLEQAD